MARKIERKKISESTVSRLFVYLREVSRLVEFNIRTISSAELAERVNLNAAQVRKDLGYFGHFGVTGSGYDTRGLEKELEKILKKDRSCEVAIVGGGNLGTALISYVGFKKHGVEVVAAFDADPEKIGKKHGTITMQSIDEMPKTVSKKKIAIGVIAVPVQNAQEVADKLVDAGIKCILNFAPVGLNVPESVKVKDVDLSREMETLSYYAGNEIN